MRAAILTGFGGEEVMTVGEVSDLARGDQQALIEVRAAGLNPVELPMRNGTFGRAPYSFPQVPGFDVSGVVLEAPEGSQLKPGQEVYGRLPSSAPGAYAERVVIDATLLAPKPDRLSHVEAASLPTVALTSWQALVERARLTAGERLLIQAGAGGVGTFAVQLAKHLGAHVSATAGPSNQAFLEQLGVDRPIDYSTARFEDAGPFDVVYDGVGGELISRSINSLALGGRYVGLVNVGDARAFREIGLPEEIAKTASIGTVPFVEQAAARGAEFHGVITRPDGEQLREIGLLVNAGVIKPVVSHVFSLDRWRDAYVQLATGRTRGKVVLELGG